MLYRKIIKTKQQQFPYLESRRLLKLYETEYVSSNEDETGKAEARKAFEASVERRMLLNCRCNCSGCLDDRSSDIESPGLSRNLLNRPLLPEWLKQVRTNQTIEVDNCPDAASVCDRIRVLLEEGYQAIYLRVKSDRLLMS